MDKFDNIVTKGVAFNLSDPDQKKMFEHASKRTNFSGYIKRLIQRDIEGKYQPSRQQIEEPSVELDEGLMQKLI